MQLFECQTSFLVLASFVLEPDADDARTQSGHLDQLFFHQSIRARIGRVAGAQRVQLFFVQHRTYSSRLVLNSAATSMSGRRPTTGATCDAANARASAQFNLTTLIFFVTPLFATILHNPTMFYKQLVVTII